MTHLWSQIAAAAGMPLDAERIQRLERYLAMMLEAGRRVNLTAIRDIDAARLHHIADSLTLLRFIPADAALLADVGSGGGLPGIPLAIARPGLRVVLIEATKKKARLLEQFIAQLGLEGVTVVPERAEAVARGLLREKFDVAVARALARLDVLLEWCMPLVKPGGRVLAMKGPQVAGEIDAARRLLPALGGNTLLVHDAGVPALAGHVIVEAVKDRSSGNRLPRKPK